MTHALIEFRDVHKTLGTTYVLRGTNLKIPKGEITTIIGNCGTGKSVFFKHIIGLLSPDKGDIICDGKPMSDMSRSELWEWRGKFSYMFQNMALFDSMTIFENVALPLAQGTNLPKEEIKKRAQERLRQLDLEGIDHKYPSELSGGMQKRVAMARALVTDPEIILFDEPTTGLDPIRKNAVHSMISEYQSKFGFTVMLISHEIPDVFYFSQRIAMLHEGKIIYAGAPEELQKVDDPAVHDFISGFEGQTEIYRAPSSGGAWQIRFSEEMARLQHHRVPFALVVLTIENMGAIAAQSGPVVAQTTVDQFAAGIRRHLRITDTCECIGSNAVLLLLPFTDVQKARMVCAKLGRELSGQPVQQIRPQMDSCLAVSAGFTEPADEDDAESCLNRALAQKEIFYKFSIC